MEAKRSERKETRGEAAKEIIREEKIQNRRRGDN